MLDDVRTEARTLRRNSIFVAAPHLRWHFGANLAVFAIGAVAFQWVHAVRGRYDPRIAVATVVLSFLYLFINRFRLLRAWSVRVGLGPTSMSLKQMHSFEERDFLKRFGCSTHLAKGAAQMMSYEQQLEGAIACQDRSPKVELPGEKFLFALAMAVFYGFLPRFLNKMVPESELAQGAIISAVVLVLLYSVSLFAGSVKTMISIWEQFDRNLLGWLRSLRHCRDFHEDPAPWLDHNGDPRPLTTPAATKAKTPDAPRESEGPEVGGALVLLTRVDGKADVADPLKGHTTQKNT